MAFTENIFNPRLFVEADSGMIRTTHALGLDNPSSCTLNNISIGETAPIVYSNAGRTAQRHMTWSLHPAVSRKPPGSLPSQPTVTCPSRDENAFNTVGQHRGIVPLSGYVDWFVRDGIRQPCYIFSTHGPLLIPVLWTLWQGEHYSFALVTRHHSSGGFDPFLLNVVQAKHWINSADAGEEFLMHSGSADPQMDRYWVDSVIVDRNVKEPVKRLTGTKQKAFTIP